MTEEPFSVGKFQLIIMLLLETEVVGAVGYEGAIACRIEKTEDVELYPNWFLASTLNS